MRMAALRPPSARSPHCAHSLTHYFARGQLVTFAFRDFFGISHSILDSLPVVLVCMKRTLFCMKRDVTYVCVYVHHVKQSGIYRRNEVMEVK